MKSSLLTFETSKLSKRKFKSLYDSSTSCKFISCLLKSKIKLILLNLCLSKKEISPSLTKPFT